MKHTYYSTCPICGANLDPGEKCTCTAERKGGDTMYDTDRSGYIDAITKLLEKADLRKLRLIWVYVERMTRTN